MTSLVKRIERRLEAAAGKHSRPLGAYVIFVKNADGLDHQLRKMAEAHAWKQVSLGIGAPPVDYEVSDQADVTVVIYNVARRYQQKVTANFALRKGELDEAHVRAIENALVQVLPK